MVTVGVYAGISFGTYANSTQSMYVEIYEDDEDGVNLPDIWAENTVGFWEGDDAESLCQEISEEWPSGSIPMSYCEPRVRVSGLMFESEGESESIIPAIWYGIDEGVVDRVWMPEDDCCPGRLAIQDDEIVIDGHAIEGLGISVGDNVTIGAGQGRLDYRVVGIGYYSSLLYFAVDGSIVPAESGTLVSGYLSDSGISRLANLPQGSANLLLIDVEGTPAYDLQGTDQNEGDALNVIIESVNSVLESTSESPAITYDRSGVYSVEILRQDAKGAADTFPFITGMLAMVAGITIFLSLQRLIQSQSREIAILRTLGIPRSAIIPGFMAAPLVMGLIGCALGILLGVLDGGPRMVSLYESVIGIPATGFYTDPSLVFEISAITMFVVMVSGIRPALQASRTQPLEVLRGDNEIRLSSRWVQDVTSRLPATMGLTVRSSIRKPVRMLLTFLAVGLSMVIFGTMTMMMDSVDDIFGNDSANWDAQVNILPGGEGPVIEWANEMGADYEQLLVFPGSAEGDGRIFSAYGLDEFSTSRESMITLEILEGSIPEKGRDIPQVLVDEGTMGFLGWEVGETHTLIFGTKSSDVEISGTTMEMSRTVYFHRNDLSVITGIEATSILLSLPEQVEVDGQLADLSVGITEKQDLIDSFDALMELQKGVYNAIMALGVIIAIAVLFNTLLMNLSERDTELATLRVLGAPISKIRMMMLGENIAIGLIGGILAVFFTVLMAQSFIASLVNWSFYFTLQPQTSAIFELVGVVIAISVLCTPYGSWRISRMNLVEKVKDLSQ
jgi:putative ABC transport system permease protein